MSTSERVALVPAGYNLSTFAVPSLSSLRAITVQIGGVLVVKDNISAPCVFDLPLPALL